MAMTRADEPRDPADIPLADGWVDHDLSDLSWVADPIGALAADTAIRALRTTGMDHPAIVRQLADTLGAEVMRPVLEDLLETGPDGWEVYRLLDVSAERSPELANEWTGDLLAEGRIPEEYGDGRPNSIHLDNKGWLASLPDGLKVDGSLVLPFDMGLKALPERLTVGKDLDIYNSGLRTLPRGLKVARRLSVFGCRDWDGVIPDDAEIGVIHSDEHRFGITLRE